MLGTKQARSCRCLLQALLQTTHAQLDWFIFGNHSPMLPKTCQLFPPDVIFITRERKPKSNISSTWRLTVGCTHTKWLPEDGLIWHHLFCVDGITSNPRPAALFRHCGTAGKQEGVISGGLNCPDCRKQKERLFVWKPSRIGSHSFFRQTSHCYLRLTGANLSKYCIYKENSSMLLSKILQICSICSLHKAVQLGAKIRWANMTEIC